MKDDALQSLIGGVGWSVKGDTVIYHADAPREPSEEEITTEMTRLEAEYDAQEYARNRAAEYPSIAELTVALYDTDDKAAIETKRAAVKAKYPKPS
jgi:hypothetical protein